MSFEQGDLATAGEKAERGFREIGNSNPEQALRFRVLQAEVLAWQGKPAQSLALLKDVPPRSLADSSAAARRLIVIGTAYYLTQQFDDAFTTLQQAKEISASNYPNLLGDVTMAQATLATYKRDYAAAEKLNLQALEIARRSNRRYLEASALGSLGFMSLRQQHYDAAIDWFAPSLAISQQLGNKTLSAKTLGNLGWCYFKLGDYERATANFQQAEDLSVRLGLVKDQFVWLTNLGNVHYEQRDYPGAADYYGKALVIARRLDNKPGIAACLTNLASTALETSSYDQAEKYNREALILKRAIGDLPEEWSSVLNQARIAAGRKQYSEAKALLDQVIANSGQDLSLRWEAESELASTDALAGKNVAAEMHFRRALADIDEARAALTKEEHRLSFLSSAERFYDDYIDFLVSRRRTREALRVTEHSRARTLAEGLKISVGRLPQTVFNPEQTARKFDHIILSYWLGPQRSYLWVVRGSGLTIFKLPGRKTIEAEAGAYRKVLMSPRDPKDIADANGTALYSSLVEPAQKLIPHGSSVTVIGDGVLNTVSFATLLVPNPRLHYWIEDVVVSNASSIALLSGSATHSSSRTAQRELLLIGNPVYANGQYPELRQAELEIKEVSRHFPAASSTILEGTAATPAAYLASGAGHFSHIHFVAHATASRITPLDSSIMLSPDQSKLYARDIVKEPLRADLVTISACYGAGNQWYSGEGLVGLAWAFLRAGARNVVAALWDVSDNSTPQLMDAMYTKLAEGADPASALREGQLMMLHSGTVYRRPFYWGPFQVYSGRQ